MWSPTALAFILAVVGGTSERRREWRTAIELQCRLHRRSGKVVPGRTVDIGPGGMRVQTTRPLTVDETMEFELPERAGIRGRARVVREHGYGVYALRFEKLGAEARTEIAELAQRRDPATG